MPKSAPAEKWEKYSGVEGARKQIQKSLKIKENESGKKQRENGKIKW